MTLVMTREERETFLAEPHVGAIGLLGGVGAAVDPADEVRDPRPMAHRYLGPELGDRYVEATRGTGDANGIVRVGIRPERWLPVGDRKQFSV